MYPRRDLAADANIPETGSGFGGIALAHNVRTREEVDTVIAEAVNAGGSLLKAAHQADWGGYSGYFADPDGYPLGGRVESVLPHGRRRQRAATGLDCLTLRASPPQRDRVRSLI